MKETSLLGWLRVEAGTEQDSEDANPGHRLEPLNEARCNPGMKTLPFTSRTFGLGTGTWITKLQPRRPILSALEEGLIHPKGKDAWTVTV